MILTAHSGSDGTPDNSLTFVEKMMEYPVPAIEIDVRKAPNGKLYLKHDAIHSDEEAELLLSLDTLFRTTFRKKSAVMVNCDLKEEKLEAEVKWLADKWELYDRVVFSGKVDPEHVSVWDRDKIFYNIENCLPNIRGVKQLKKAHFDVVHYFCRKYNIHTLNINESLCSKEWIEYCHENQLRLSVWTVDQFDRIEELKAQNVYNVTTCRALAYLHQREKTIEGQSGISTKMAE